MRDVRHGYTKTTKYTTIYDIYIYIYIYIYIIYTYIDNLSNKLCASGFL